MRTILIATGAAAALAAVVLYTRRSKRKLSLTSARRVTPAEITVGAIWIGPGGGPNGDGDRPDLGHANAVATVRCALEAGVRDFDTAPWYGSGASEERLGRAITELQSSGFEPARAANVTTKIGRLVRSAEGGVPAVPFDGVGQPALASRRFANDYTANGAETSLQESLGRLGLQRVYGLRVHDPNDNSLNKCGASGFVDEVAISLTPDAGCLAALRSLRRGARIAEVSLGMNANKEAHQGAPDEILRLLEQAPRGTFDAALLAGGWNLLSQAGLPCFAACERHGVDVHVTAAAHVKRRTPPPTPHAPCPDDVMLCYVMP
jgi:aryl-alcohol dehydrogenase-like predicted oxidoreductase